MIEKEDSVYLNDWWCFILYIQWSNKNRLMSNKNKLQELILKYGKSVGTMTYLSQKHWIDDVFFLLGENDR